MKSTVRLNTWVVLLAVGTIGFLLMALISELEKQPTTGLWLDCYEILKELGKAAFIGTSAGVAIKRLLPLAEENREIAPTGIDAVYASRPKTLPVFLQAVKNRRIKNISMIGISLREFLFPANLHEVWQAIGERLKEEQKAKVPEKDRLKVRLLLLDPTCTEGDFRSQIERGLPNRLDEDVPQSVLTVVALCNELDSEGSPPHEIAKFGSVVEARLYQHGSFAFQFITDEFAIVEQYTYHRRLGGGTMPLLQYKRFSEAYEQLAHGYDITWEAASPAPKDLPKVGLGKPLRESHLTRIYRQDDRGHLTEREKCVLSTRGPGEIVAIQALTGKFYMQRIIDQVETAVSRGGRGAKIRFLVINPLSRGAILRVVADSNPIENIGTALRQWTWERHKESTLYRDVEYAIQRVQSAGRDIEIRLSAAELPCAMLLSRDSIFVEPYAYGRSRLYRSGAVLGGEYAVFEHERRTPIVNSEDKILQSAFEVLWDSYSMSKDAFLKKATQAEQTFTAELAALLSQTDEEPNERSLSMVILAAGFGTSFSAEADRIPEFRGKPKGLQLVGDKPVLEWMLECAKEIPEIQRIVIVTNEEHIDQYENWLSRTPEPSYRLIIKIISDGSRSNEDRRGAVGSLHFAITREDIKGNVLVVGADNFFMGSFKEMVKAFFEKKVGIVLTHDEGSTDRIAGRLGVVTQDLRGQIIDFEEKPQNPKSTIASTLCYALTEENVRHLRGSVRSS